MDHCIHPQFYGDAYGEVAVRPCSGGRNGTMPVICSTRVLRPGSTMYTACPLQDSLNLYKDTMPIPDSDQRKTLAIPDVSFMTHH